LQRAILSKKNVQEFGNDFGYLPQILDTQRTIKALIDYPGKRAHKFSKIARIVLDNSLSENKDAFYAQMRSSPNSPAHSPPRDL